MMNTTNTLSPTSSKRTCKWKWPTCTRWMQNNGNKLCAYHNTRFLNGEYPGAPTFVLGGATAPTATTTATNSTKKKKNEEVKKAHKARSALKKKKKRAVKEQLTKKAAKTLSL